MTHIVGFGAADRPPSKNNLVRYRWSKDKRPFPPDEQLLRDLVAVAQTGDADAKGRLVEHFDGLLPGDHDASDRLVEHFHGWLIGLCSKPYASMNRADFADVLGAALEGFGKAIFKFKRFDEGRPTTVAEFIACAKFWAGDGIRTEVRRINARGVAAGKGDVDKYISAHPELIDLYKTDPKAAIDAIIAAGICKKRATAECALERTQIKFKAFHEVDTPAFPEISVEECDGNDDGERGRRRQQRRKDRLRTHRLGRDGEWTIEDRTCAETKAVRAAAEKRAKSAGRQAPTSTDEGGDEGEPLFSPDEFKMTSSKLKLDAEGAIIDSDSGIHVDADGIIRGAIKPEGKAPKLEAERTQTSFAGETNVILVDKAVFEGKHSKSDPSVPDEAMICRPVGGKVLRLIVPESKPAKKPDPNAPVMNGKWTQPAEPKVKAFKSKKAWQPHDPSPVRLIDPKSVNVAELLERLNQKKAA
jgi:hypothetical protein